MIDQPSAAMSSPSGYDDFAAVDTVTGQVRTGVEIFLTSDADPKYAEEAGIT
jgi:hypothetical protein